MNKTISNFVNVEKEQLWGNFLQGDKRSFEEIYRRNIKDLLNYGYKVTSDKRLIEDSVQDLFYELWQSKERLSETSSIKFYLLKALRYKIIRNAKDRKIDFTDQLNDSDISSDDCNHERHLIEIESLALHETHLKDIISRLPRRQQEAINLRYYHNFSNEEIAAIMDVNYQSACKFIYTALKSLKLNLKASAL